jgi:hypothetical protein
MRLKRHREQKVAVDPPGHSWLYDILQRDPSLKRMMPSQLEADRAEACSKGRVGDWFKRIAAEIDVNQ